ncbi:MAG: hypothetical protein ACRDE9_03810 [Candidatus Limnocylindria bacterium]
MDGEAILEQDASPDPVPAVGIWARRYLLEPGDGPWYDMVRTLREALGDDETYDLLRAIEIRFRTSGTK